MKKRKHRVLTVFIVILMAIQFYRPARNSSLQPELATNFTKIYDVPLSTQAIFKTSCYDCHSNNTKYPWYSNIQPVRMFMDNHINEGKNHLNFSEFGKLDAEKQTKKLDEIIEEVSEGDMPLFSYTLIHRDAILNASQKAEVINWIESVLEIKK